MGLVFGYKLTYSDCVEWVASHCAKNVGYGRDADLDCKVFEREDSKGPLLCQFGARLRTVLGRCCHIMKSVIFFFQRCF